MALQPATYRAELVRRLRCAEGHLRGIVGMLEADADCEAALQQLLAVQGAFDAVERRLVKHYLDDCLPIELQALDPVSRERALERVIGLYSLMVCCRSAVSQQRNSYGCNR